MLIQQIELDHKKIEVLLSDGTVVEDETYFRTLPSQTVLIFKRPGETVLRGERLIAECSLHSIAYCPFDKTTNRTA